MNPQNDHQNGRVGTPPSDQRQQLPVPPARSDTSQRAAADVIRGQIASIFSAPAASAAPAAASTTPTPPAAGERPIAHAATTPAPRTILTTTPAQPPKAAAPATTPSASPRHGLRTTPPTLRPAQTTTTATASTTPRIDEAQWSQYHSAWQKYYQLYYERYYLNHLHAKQQELSASLGAPNTKTTAPDDTAAGISPHEAIRQLRAQIRQKVATSAMKVKKSRHFMPIVAGLVVVVLFGFLQYNRVIFGAVAAYTSPGNIEPQHIIAGISTDIAVDPDPRLIIPRINVNTPVVYGVGPDHASQMAAMEKGVAHFSIPGANAIPGQIGNTVLAGHSSNDVFAPGDYKFIFADNEKLETGDMIYAHYQGKRYAYAITKKEVVLPTEVSRVQIETTKPLLTLVSCVPLGTAHKRLLIFAEQISPDPAAAQTAPANDAAPSSTDIPGKPSPTLLERLFGA